MLYSNVIIYITYVYSKHNNAGANNF